MSAVITGPLRAVASSMAGALRVPGFDNELNLPETSRYVFFLIDGLGEDLVRNHADLAPTLSSMDNRVLQSAVPSTTAVSLTSIGTGQLPGCHGIAGYTMNIPGTGKRLNALKWDAPIDPRQWQAQPTVWEQSAEAGIAVWHVNNPDFQNSGLTVSAHRGATWLDGVDHEQRMSQLATVLGAPGPSITYLYESSVDHAGHQWGTDSDQWREALAAVDRMVAEVRAVLPDDTTLLVTADHGMIDIPRHGRFDVADHPDLMTDVELFAGEARFRHLHTRPGTAAAVAERWRDRLGTRAEVRLREDATDWFGELDPAVAERFGDVVVAALDQFGVFSSSEFFMETRMRGFHGSVTDRERLVPLLVDTRG